MAAQNQNPGAKRFTRIRSFSLVLLFSLDAEATARAGLPSDEDIRRALSVGKRFENTVFRASIEPTWLPGGTGFWYRVQTGPEAWETVHVDAVTGRRTPGYTPPPDTAPRDAENLPTASGEGGADTTFTVVNQRSSPVRLFWLNRQGRRQSYGEVAPGATREQHTYEGHAWLVANEEGVRLDARVVPAGGLRLTLDDTDQPKPETPCGRRRGTAPTRGQGPWKISVQDGNLWLEHTGDGTRRRLTDDAAPGEAYRESVVWSPDGARFLAFRVKDAPVRTITLVENLPKEGGPPRSRVIEYDKPGDEQPRPRLFLFSATDGRRVEVANDLFPNPFTSSGTLDARWAADGSEVYLDYNQRGHQIYRILAVNATNGAVRTVVEESPATFVDYTNKTWRHWLDASGELLWMSERDGWNHLYRVDVASGRVKNPVTTGHWVVRGVERVDEEAGQVWFWAGGVRPGEDPYHLHLCRVNLDGSGFVRLTEGDGTHAVAFSPDRRWFVDTWSRADHPPVIELRRADDGSRVCEMERADITALLATGWLPPERFVAKGRDRATDIHGLILRPLGFNPARRYPVLEDIFAGPQDAHVPKEFGRQATRNGLASLGFVIVQIDGMGTNWRSKAFHDVCWKNLADAGFPDRIAWLRAAAATRPWMDLGRVGIYGGSAGGQNALGAVLFHGDVYHAAAADCGCHDNRMDKLWWNEQWMGWPVGPHYAEQSNVTHAHRLRGPLLLTVGEVDANVDPASTLQVSAALVRAGRPHELLILPGADHGAGEQPYARLRRAAFFVQHLRPGAE